MGRVLRLRELASDIIGELGVNVLGAEMDDKPSLRGDERQHHSPIQARVRSRQMSERLEMAGRGLHRGHVIQRTGWRPGQRPLPHRRDHRRGE